MAKFYFETDAQLEQLDQYSIGIIGYGNQGRAQALNLRDSGARVVVGTRDGSSSREQALKDGFTAHTVEEVSNNCEILSIMLPDEVIPQVYSESIEPYLEAHNTFVFAHGFTVFHKTINIPNDADVVLVAPTGPGSKLRSLFEAGSGLPALLAVEQDSSGEAWQRCLAYAKGIGCLRAGGIKTTFAEETVTDLYCEQAVLCGGMPELIKASFETLVQSGYQPELAYISCLKEVKLIADLLFERGLDGMRQAISNTAKFGSAVAGPALVNEATRHELASILSRIESGQFGKQFLQESACGSPVTNSFVSAEKHSGLTRTGLSLRDDLHF